MKLESKIENLIFQETKGLSEATLKEILDFVLFLKQKSAGSTPKSTIFYDLQLMQSSEVNHLEEEFADYKKLFPLEE
ncbi:hypothetical protein NF867_02570 [Solitalea sp. MAHUQ-68]|uniref:DUF2281 domain-containing protein n=1 Tax=Solitalea agri TaxID=2953739 RepID=A0A9X2JB74_9SPHI|nr:hypothetical protein [Solitalea agri]MCO4291743.1 hypothetical protein [Solitalea agri]